MLGTSGVSVIVVVAVLVLSVTVHEFAHAYVATRAGDPTPNDMGRVTLNPLAHLDPVWSLALPAFFYAFGGMFLGAGKPVPVSPLHLTRWGYAASVAAGPISNLLLAVTAGLGHRLVRETMPEAVGVEWVLATVVLLNLALAAFNLLPLPPLDGSSIVAAIFFRQPGLGGPEALFAWAAFLVLWVTGALGAVYGPVMDFLLRILVGVGLW